MSLRCGLSINRDGRWETCGVVLVDGRDGFSVCPLHAYAADSLVTLKDVAEWLETGEVDGVKYDEASVLEAVRATVKKMEA